MLEERRYRGTSIIIKRPSLEDPTEGLCLGPYGGPTEGLCLLGTYGGPVGEGRFLMNEMPLGPLTCRVVRHQYL